MINKHEQPKSSKVEDKAKHGSVNSESIAEAHFGSNVEGATVKSLVDEKVMNEEVKRQEDEQRAKLPLAEQLKIDVKNIIKSDAEAVDLINREYRATAPEGVTSAHVTSDANVFWPSNGGSAHAHAQAHNLKLFTVTWD